jgi:type I restriction enzyme, S subunit
LKREIPEGWDSYSLSELLKHNYKSIGKNESFPVINYLDTSSLTKNNLEDTQKINAGKEKVPSRAQRIVNKNDILYSTVRPNLCHYGIIKHPVKNMIASTGFVQLSSKMDWVSNDLIYTYLTSSWVTQRLHQIAALSVSSYPSILLYQKWGIK